MDYYDIKPVEYDPNVFSDMTPVQLFMTDEEVAKILKDNNIHYDNCMYIASYYFIDKSNVYKNKIAMFVNLSGGIYQDSPYGDLYFFVKDGVIVHTCRPPEIGTSRPEMVFNDVLIHTGFIDDTEIKEEEVVVKSSTNYSVSGNV